MSNGQREDVGIQPSPPAGRKARSHEERRLFIVQLLSRTGEVDVREVAQQLGVSQMTVRRDLARLDRAGVLRRVHGGATMRASPTSRSEVMAAEKHQIAVAVAKLIDDGDVVGIDVGSTCTATAAQLAMRPDLTIVTNSVHAALPFQYSHSSLLLLGGVMTEEASLVDGGLLDNRRRIQLNKLVLGCGGVSITAGISYFDLRETAIREDLLKRSDLVILAADHSKFDLIKPIILGGLDMVDVLVTDSRPDRKMAAALKKAAVEVIVAR